MRFVIRDDDTCFFTKPSDLEWWYKDIFAQNIPVGIAVIPFIRPQRDNFPFEVSADLEYSVGGNKELVQYILQRPLIEVLQHGCTHEKIGDTFEYQQRSGLVEVTKRGKQELEVTFQKPVRVFCCAPRFIIESCHRSSGRVKNECD